MAKLSLRSRYSLILLAVATAILAAGIVFRPKRPPEAHQLSESEMFRLQTITQQQRLDDMAAFLSDAAERMATHLLYIRERPYTAVIRDDKAVTSGFAPDHARVVQAVTSRADAVDIEVAPAPRGSILQLFTIAGNYRPPANSPAPLTPGDWVMAVARNSERQTVFAQGLYQSTSAARCGDFAYRAVYSSVPLSPALVGGGLFTMDGDLVGVIADCRGQPVAVDMQTVDELLHRPVPVNDRLLDEYGFGAAEAPGGGGVLVTSIWDGSRAERAGIQPGDLIAAVDDVPVATLADLARLADDGGRADHTAALFRGRKQLRVTVPSRVAEVVLDAPGGLKLGRADHEPAVVVRSVVPGSAATLAGVQPGDVVAAIDGRTVDNPQDAVKLISRKTVVMTIRRDGNTAQVLLAPGEAAP